MTTTYSQSLTSVEIDSDISKKSRKKTSSTLKKEATPIYFDIKDLDVYPKPKRAKCKKKWDKERQLRCINNHIGDQFAKEFDSEIARKLRLRKGTHRIQVNFVIDEIGNITKIKSFSRRKGLQAEGERIFKELPRMLPGMYHGKTVKVNYNFEFAIRIN
ncbi:hypothetical protein [Lutibacter sp. Hel_I_33_5]|uniref:hypothetical protein n=1 Tax=Lutibacter sp. Hel_I_33_5 TaxID=1566289 RepID=UPI0011A15829|nr:hypothetical protein [Lutibacter sp. Hel_I_33_5]